MKTPSHERSRRVSNTPVSATHALLLCLAPFAWRGGLEESLSAVSPEVLRKDLSYLASDELAGRDTPSAGLQAAAEYIAARLEERGFEPGAEGGWFAPYPLEHSALSAERTHIDLEVRGERLARLELGRDYFPRKSGHWEDASFSGPVVFAGGGSKDELEDLELEGAWALVLEHRGRGESAIRVRAERAGARGVLLVPTEDYAGRPLAERFGARARGLIEGHARYPRAERPPSRAIFPQVWVEREAMGAALEACGAAALDELELGARLDVVLRDDRVLAHPGGRVEAANVCGLWPGEDPVLGQEVLIVSAHYDHVGVMRGEVYNGADDNASGTSALLSIADGLAARGPLRRSVLLIWVSGEEKGLWGSRAWCDDPWLPEGMRPVMDLNLDMVGRNAPEEILLTPSPEHPERNGIADLATALAPLEGFQRVENGDEYYDRSDQANFARLDIPVVFLHTDDHEDYHEPTDTPEKIDYDKLARVTRLALRLLDGLQTDNLDF